MIINARLFCPKVSYKYVLLKKKARTMRQTPRQDPARRRWSRADPGPGPARRRRGNKASARGCHPARPAPSRGWRLPLPRAATYRGSDSASASAASPISATITGWLAAHRRDARACTRTGHAASGRGGTGRRGRAPAVCKGGGRGPCSVHF